MKLSEKLNGMATSYNLSRSSAESKVREDIRNKEGNVWDLYTKEAQIQKVNEYKKELVNRYRGELQDFNTELNNEQKKIFNKIRAVKYPNLSSSDDNKKIIGESQVSQAYSFLSSPKREYQITQAIRESLEAGRLEFAFTLMDTVINERPERINEPLTDKQKSLINEVTQIYNSYPGKEQIDSIHKEESDLSKVSNAVGSFDYQLSQNYPAVLLPELSSVMSDKEKEDLYQVLDSPGSPYSTIERIALKRQLSEA